MARLFQILLILALLALIIVGLYGMPEETTAPEPRAQTEAPAIEAPPPPLPEPQTEPATSADSARADDAPEAIRPAPVPRPSGLIIPVAGIEPDELIDTFEDARSQNRTHDAIDIIAPHRAPVLAATDGRIVRLFESDHGGLTIYQFAPDRRTVYYYAHLDGYAPGLAAGDTVRQGQTIGYVGDTGNAQPGNHHLHFAIWITDDPADFWDGEPVNPYPLLRN